MKKVVSLAVATIGIVILSSAQMLAQSGYYAVTNNDPPSTANSATIFKLESKALTITDTLQTGGNGGGGGDFNLIRVIVANTGSNLCLFVADAGSSDVAAFQLPSLKKAGNFTDPKGNSDGFGYSIGLASRGNLLFVGYGVSSNIGVFEIGAGCKLSLLGTYDSTTSVAGMRATPDGKTLLVGYGYGENLVDSYSISSTGVLTENGPYPSQAGAAGVDITSDGKYAVFGDATGGTTQIEVFPINSNGTLGSETSFGGDGSLGTGQDSSSVWLSPNGKFLFVVNNLSKQVTSLGFSESPLTISYVGLTTLQDSSQIISVGGLTTVSPSGNGGGLYVAEFSSPDGLVGLLQINADGTTTEAPTSPFNTGTSSSLLSVAAYPPRSY
jgi:6-phosphogluconolactonase (cycloisomerase 2 family)